MINVKRNWVKPILVVAIGVVVMLVTVGISGCSADNNSEAGELSIGDRASRLNINRVEVIDVVSDNSVLVKKLPYLFADGTTSESNERGEYDVATGDELLAMFSDPYVEDSLDRIKTLEVGDIVQISYWGNTKIDYSHEPWSVECESLESSS